MRPLGGGHLATEPFFADRGDHADVTLPEYRRQFDRLPRADDPPDMIYGVSALLHPVRVWRAPAWQDFAPADMALPDRAPVSSGTVRRLALDDQTPMLELVALLRRIGRHVFAIEAPHPFRHHPALRRTPAAVVMRVDRLYRTTLRAELARLGVPVVDVPAAMPRRRGLHPGGVRPAGRPAPRQRGLWRRDDGRGAGLSAPRRTVSGSRPEPRTSDPMSLVESAPAPKLGMRAKVIEEYATLFRTHGLAGPVLEIAGGTREGAVAQAPFLDGFERHVVVSGDGGEAGGVHFHKGDPNDLAPLFDDACFSAVIWDRALERDPRFWLTVAEIRRVLAPGGALVLCTRGFAKTNKFGVQGRRRQRQSDLLHDRDRGRVGFGRRPSGVSARRGCGASCSTVSTSRNSGPPS